MNDARNRLAELYAKRKRDEDNYASPEKVAERKSTLDGYDDNAALRGLAASLSSSAANIGAIDGKTAETDTVQKMGDSLNRIDQGKISRLGDARKDSDRRFGVDSKVFGYLADKEAKDEKDKYNKDRDVKADEHRNKVFDATIKQRGISNEINRTKATNAAEKDKKKNATDFDTRISKLGGEERKRLDSSVMGFLAVKGMSDALLNDNDNTFSLIGDNNYTMNAARFEEALGRMQSGGAINDKEAARFRLMAPGTMDGSDMQRTKLKDLLAEMGSRVKNLGFTPEEMLASRYEPEFDDEWKPEDEGGLMDSVANFFTGDEDEATAAEGPDKKFDPKTVRMQNGDEILNVDINDVKEAEAEGFKKIGGGQTQKMR